MYLLLAAVSPTVVAIMFGVNYLDGVPVMMVFCLKYAFNGVNGVCGALQTATGRTDIGLKWTIYLIASTAVVYYSTSYFGITTFLWGIFTLTFVNAFLCWYIQFKQMVDITFSEYLTIYTRSFFICVFLSILTYLIYSDPSTLYLIMAGVLYVPLFAFLILRSRDGNEIIDVMKTMNMPIKVIIMAEKMRK
jgi:teichuronic acid exporter